MELSEDSDEKPRKHKARYSPERRSRERESSYKKRSHRERSEERRYDDRRRRDKERSRHHSSRDDYSEKRHRSDKYRHNDTRSRGDRRSSDKYDRKYRGNTERSNSGYSESDKYKRSSRDDNNGSRRRRHRSRSASREKSRDTRYRSHSRSKERADDRRLTSSVSQQVTSTTASITQGNKEKSPDIAAVTTPPIIQNPVNNPVVAERKLAKLDQLGITLHTNSLTASSSKLPEGVEIPAYYNPNAINVTKYAEQIQKRKLLWSGKKSEPAAATSTWNKATFSQDTDGKVASKFMRLMGIKDGVPPPQPEANAESDLDKQKKLFSTMEQQYEVARQVTHTMRGVGLGFGSQPRQF
ncbi:arginine/serine-rich coiled-coil protein 2 isoform X2 [Culicoides brevitarsis]